MRVWRSKCPAIRARRACPHAAGGWSLSAASDAIGAALSVVEVWYFGDVVGGDGDYYELCDVVTGGDVLGLVASVMQAQLDFAGETAVDDAGSVTEHQVLLNPGAAAHEHHAHMSTWHGYVHAGVSYPVSTNRNGEVMFQGEVYAGVVFVGLAWVSSTFI